jgi:hypothetical protein
VVTSARAIALLAVSACHWIVPVPSDVDLRDATTSDDGVDAAACTTSDMCLPSEPYCDPSSGTCRPCELPQHCESGACLPDGTCADQGAVLYASPDGDSSTCTRADPCEVHVALSLVDIGRRIVSCEGGDYDLPSTLGIDRDVTIVGAGPSETLIKRQPGGGLVIEVIGGSTVTLGNLTIHQANGDGIRCTSSTMVLDRVVSRDHGNIGLQATGCTLTVDRSAFLDNSFGITTNGPLQIQRSVVLGNSVGGIDADVIMMRNSVVVRNGGPASFGGVQSSTGGTIELSTIADNASNVAGQGGVSCGAGTIVQSSILFGNGAVDPDCNHNYIVSDVAIPGDDNVITTDVMFVSRDQPYDYHILAGSPATGRGDPSTDVDIDFDGDVRPIPAGTRVDAGADEIP